jgi:hypothetical protein
MEDLTPEEYQKCIICGLYEFAQGNKNIATSLYHEVFSHIPGYNPKLIPDDMSRGWRDYDLFVSGGTIDTIHPRAIQLEAFDNVHTLCKNGLEGTVDYELMGRILGVGDERLNDLRRNFGYLPKEIKEEKRTRMDSTSRYRDRNPRGDSSRKGISYRTSSN